jgi:hypothetical protein
MQLMHILIFAHVGRYKVCGVVLKVSHGLTPCSLTGLALSSLLLYTSNNRSRSDGLDDNKIYQVSQRARRPFVESLLKVERSSGRVYKYIPLSQQHSVNNYNNSILLVYMPPDVLCIVIQK